MTNEYNALSPEETYIIINKGTEAPFSGKYDNFFEGGIYVCKQCEAPLYRSQDKFQSHCGWPSFDRPAEPSVLEERLDRTHGMVRVEIRCSSCDGHLGHLFPDGPTETGNRYCINGVCLVLKAN